MRVECCRRRDDGVVGFRVSPAGALGVGGRRLSVDVAKFDSRRIATQLRRQHGAFDFSFENGGGAYFA